MSGMTLETALNIVNTILWAVFAFTGSYCMRLGRQMRDEAKALDDKTRWRMELFREATALAQYGAFDEARSLIDEACAPQ